MGKLKLREAKALVQGYMGKDKGRSWGLNPTSPAFNPTPLTVWFQDQHRHLRTSGPTQTYYTSHSEGRPHPLSVNNPPGEWDGRPGVRSPALPGLLT